MKVRPRISSSIFHDAASQALIAISALALLNHSALAASGTYTNPVSGGLYADPTNWAGGIVADGADSTADFSTLDLTLDNTVTIAASRTLGYLIFGDTTPSNNWIIGDTASSGNVWTLSTTAAGTAPAITVISGTATLQVALAGTQGFVKNGSGTLVLNTNANTWTGNAVVNAGTLSVQIAQSATAGFVLNNGTSLTGTVSLANTNFIYASSGTSSININGGSATLSALFFGNGNINWNEVGLSNVSGGGAATSIFGNFGGTVAWGTSGSGIRVSSGTGTTINPFANFDLGSGTGNLSNKSGSTTDVLGGLQSEGTGANIGGGGNGMTGRALIFVVGSANLSQTFGGTITNFSGAGGAGTQFIKVGTGTLTLTGVDAAANTFVGSTATGGFGNVVHGGTLLIDDVSTTSSVLAAGSLMAVGNGGTLSIKGKATGTSTETVAGTTVQTGGGAIVVDPNGGGGTTLNLGTMTATAGGGSLNISQKAGTAAVTTTTAASADGTYGGRITFTDAAGNTNWAATASGAAPYTFSGYSAYTPFVSSGGTGTVARLLTDGGAMTATQSFSSLKINTTMSGQALDLGGFTLTLANGGLLFTGSNDYTLGVTAGDTLSTGLATNPGIIVSQYGTGNLTIAGVIANGAAASNLTKAGPGLLTLSGSNTYTGITYLNGGITRITANANLGAEATGAALNLNGGTLQATATFGLFNTAAGTNDRAVNIGGGGGSFDVTSGNTLTVSGIVGNALANEFGPLIKADSGTLVLSNPANTYGGATFITGGILSISTLANGNTVSSIGQSPATANALVLNGGTLQYNGAVAGSTDRTFTLGVNGGGLDSSSAAAGNTMTFSNFLPVVASGTGDRILSLGGTNTGANTFAGSIVDPSSGTTGLTKTGVGKWILSGVSSLYTGITNVSSGILALVAPSTNNISASKTVFVASGATLDVTGLTGGAIVLGPTQTLSGRGTVSGAVYTSAGTNLTPGNAGINNGIGTLSMSALTLSTGVVNNFEFGTGNDLISVTTSGGLVINGGSFNLYAAGSSAKFTGTGVFNLFQYTGAIGGTGVAALNNSSVLNPVAGYSYAFGTAGGYITLSITGSGLTNSNWINTGGGSWGTGGNWSSTIPNGAQTTANFVGSITANSTVTLDGTKTVGDLEFANPTSSYTIAAGTGGSLVLDNTSSAAVINDNDGTHTISAPVTLTSSAVVKVINQADKLAISGNVSNTSSPQTLTKNGLGTLALSGNNTYGPVASGTTGTILNAGTLQVGSATALGAGDLSVTASSTLQAGAASVALPNNLTIASGVTATIDTLGNVLKLSGVIGESAASATITKIGLGTLILTGANTYTGATTISNGTLQLGDGVTSGSVAGNIVNNSSLASNLAADATIGNLISGTGGFIKNGTINLTLTNANTFSGTTVLNAGVLTLGNSLALQGSTLNYNGQGGTLNFDVLTAVTLGGLSGSQNLTLTNTPATAVALTVGGNNQSTTYSGVLGGNGTGSSLTKIGAGTLTLTNAETYTGATSVQAGTLILSAGASINGTTFSNNATSTNGTFSQLIVNGGSLTTSAQSTVNQGSVGLVLNSGSVTFNGGVRITSGGGDTNALQVFGGTLTSTDVNIGRNQVLNALVTVGTGVGTGGFYVNGGAVNIGTYEIGTNNSSATSRFDAGNTTVTGQITIGNTSNTRWNVLDINGGNFTSTDAVNGIVLSPNLTVANNSEVLVAAGTLTAERIQFGAATSTGTSAIYLGGGSIYLGSGGIVDASGGTGINNVQLVTGTLGAKADWSTSVAVSIGGSFNVKAADSSNVAHNITLSGIITGTGNLTKTGAGKLSLTGSNTFSGSTIIQAGTLELASSSALPSTSTITMSGGTLSVLPGTDVMEGNLFGNGIGAMTLTANSIINFGAGNASNDLLHFDVSSGIAWTGGATLSIYNWNSSTPSSSRTQLFFGSDNTALTGSQLSQIYFYSDSGSTLLGVGAFTADGFGQLTYALVPEPGTGVMLLGGLGLMTLWGRSRRRLS